MSASASALNHLPLPGHLDGYKMWTQGDLKVLQVPRAQSVIFFFQTCKMLTFQAVNLSHSLPGCMARSCWGLGNKIVVQQ
jgi:hypothetical protein